MTMQLRYAIGVHLGRQLFTLPEQPLLPEARDGYSYAKKEVMATCDRGKALDAHWKTEWGGVRQGHRWTVSWGGNLPARLPEVFALMGHVWQLHDYPTHEHNSHHVRGGARTLMGKLRMALALPHLVPDFLKEPEHYGFERAIHADPVASANWLVYADWLEEYGDPAAMLRARVIRGMWGKKAMTMHDGVPVLALILREPHRERDLKGGV